MADGMENWRSEDYFRRNGKDPFKETGDDERPVSERTKK